MTFWSGLFERKANPTNRVILLGLSTPEGGAISPRVGFERLAREAYETNPTVYACVNEIARSVAGVPWLLYQTARGSNTKRRRVVSRKMAGDMSNRRLGRKALELSEIEDHPLLALIDRPNPEQAQAAYFEAWVGFLLLAGNAYASLVGPTTGPNRGRPIEMWQLRPDRVKVIKGDVDRVVGGYAYEVGRHKQTFEADDVLHLKLFNPTHDWYGLSPLQVALLSLRTDNEAARWNHSLIGNDARPPGALISESTLSDPEYERVKSEILQEYQGSANARRPMLLEGGLDWKTLALSPAELDFLEGRKYNRVEICAVYGVPPELIGDSDHKTYNSFPEARAAFYQETILPLLDRLRDSLNARVTAQFGDRLRLEYDPDQIEALAEDQNQLWTRLEKARHLSVNEARVASGYEPWDDPIADVPRELLSSPEPVDAFDLGEVEEEEKRHGHGLERKADAARYTPRQIRQRNKLRRIMRAHFRDQGAALVAYLERELDKLESAE